MKHPIRFFIILALVIVLLIGACWFFFFYRTDLTAQIMGFWGDVYCNAGRYNRAVSCYEFAQKYDPDNTMIPIVISRTYAKNGNYTKSEYTLVHAITEHPGEVNLYVELSKTYVAQDKLLDAAQMLDRISSKDVKQQIDALRPSDPVLSPESGYYSEYITVSAETETGTLYVCADGDFPSLTDDAYIGEFVLDNSETTVCAISVSENGLVSNAVYAGYTIGNVDEPVVLADAVLEQYVREQLNKLSVDPLMTSELWAIDTLELPEGMRTLEDLSYFTGIKNLTVHNNTGLDLSVIGNLTTLQKLDLSGCTLPTGTVEMIGTLPDLTSLNISNCAVGNIDPLINLTKLQYLNIANNSVSNIMAISSMTELKELHLTNNPIRTISFLGNCAKLEKLYVENCDISKLSSLSGNTALTELYASTNQIDDISVLESCTALSILDICGNNVEDISVLPKLAELTIFKAEHNLIQNVPTFDADTCKLVQFIVNYNEITSIAGLAKLRSLNYVKADYNKITDVTCLKGCYTIIEIDVWDNPVKSSGIAAMQEIGIIVNYNPNTAS